MIQVECECGRVIKAKDEFAGKKVRCPECQEVVALPSKSKATGATGKKPAKRTVPEDDEAFEDGEDRDADDSDEEELPRTSLKKKVKKKGTGSVQSDEKPEKKKKKKKSDDDSTKMILIGTGVFVGIALLGGLGYLIATSGGGGGGGGGGGLEVPKEYVALATPQSELTCEIPKGWDTKTGGGTGGVPAFAKIEKSNILIHFKSSPSGASIQMMSQAGSQNEEDLPDELKPVAKVHEFQKAKAQDEMSGYEEQGPPEKLITKGFGEARISAFTYDETFNKVYGYRATLLGTNNQWIVLCKCSASQWKDFQEVFKKVIQSAGGN